MHRLAPAYTSPIVPLAASATQATVTPLRPAPTFHDARTSQVAARLRPQPLLLLSLRTPAQGCNILMFLVEPSHTLST